MSPSLIDRVRSSLVIIGALYVGAVGLLAAVPWAQTHTVYLHALKFPWNADFTQPEKYGLAPNKTLNFKITVHEEQETLSLGAWFILSDAYYHSLPTLPAEPPTPDSIRTALNDYPTILFLHGNAATRAFHVRVKQYSMFSSRFKANVLALDYRGFAESDGTPSEEGLARDAHAAWDWLIANGANPEDIVVMGHSLGTGVSAKLLRDLEAEGVRPRGCVLMSPFSSISDVLKTYHLLGLIPLIQPLHMIPYAANLVTNALVHKFDTQSTLVNTTTPLIIAHALNDFDIPHSHSQVLFNSLLDPYLPPLPDIPPIATLGQGAGGMNHDWEKFSKALAERSQTKEQLVRRTDIKGLGYIEEFYAPFSRPIPAGGSVVGGSVAGSVVGSVPATPLTPAPIAPPPQTPWTPHRVWNDIGDDDDDESEAAASERPEPMVDGRMIRLIITERGKHDFIGLEEGLQDVIGRSFDLI